MDNINKIKEFWDSKALDYGTKPEATTNDVFMRHIEIDYICSYLSSFGEPLKILDIGCGNGYSTLECKKRVKWHTFTGADYSEEMIRAAREQQKEYKILNGIEFKVMDVLKLSDYKEKYDIIITDRCLINLSNLNNRKKALCEIAACLNNGGQYLMIENFIEGHVEMNRLRAYLDLPEIPVRWHNSFFSLNEFRDSIKHIFKMESCENISSLYYLVTRVVYSKLCQMEGREPDYDHPIYEVASKLPPIGDFGPVYAIKLVRR
ncbi:MAG: hypothetical protein CVU89_05105 [Firmicutes bacterium HGW-Firmicutes-14]|nr:MAG: hypothetical protein CVU89_05105 [Firmicutes bacterium HGW-Firmicutes-14]